MNLTAVEPGDIIKADVRGRAFYAVVEEKKLEKGSQTELRVTPITRNISYYHLEANQVTDHWRKAGRRAKAKASAP